MKTGVRENRPGLISRASVLVVLQIGQKGQLRDAQFVQVKRAEGRQPDRHVADTRELLTLNLTQRC